MQIQRLIETKDSVLDNNIYYVHWHIPSLGKDGVLYAKSNYLQNFDESYIGENRLIMNEIFKTYAWHFLNQNGDPSDGNFVLGKKVDYSDIDIIDHLFIGDEHKSDRTYMLYNAYKILNSDFSKKLTINLDKFLKLNHLVFLVTVKYVNSNGKEIISNQTIFTQNIFMPGLKEIGKEALSRFIIENNIDKSEIDNITFELKNIIDFKNNYFEFTSFKERK